MGPRAEPKNHSLYLFSHQTAMEVTWNSLTSEHVLSLKDSHLWVSLGEMPASVNQSDTGFSLASLGGQLTMILTWNKVYKNE